MPNDSADDITFRNNVNSNMVASFASPKRSFQLILPTSPRVLQQAKFGGGAANGGGANTAFSSSSSSLSTLSLSLGNGEALLWQQLVERLRQNHQLHHRHQNLHDVEQQIRASSSALYDPTLTTDQQLHHFQQQPNSPPSTPQSPAGNAGASDLVDHIVRVSKGQYLNVGVPSFSSPGLCPYLYVHSIKRERRIIAQLVKYKKRSASPSSAVGHSRSHSAHSGSSSSGGAAFCKPVYTTQKLSIPLNYAGFFEILSEDGRATRCIHSVSELLRRFPDACIVRSTGVRAYSPLVLANNNAITTGKRPSGHTSGNLPSNVPYESMPNDGYSQDGDDADAERSQFVSSVVGSRQDNKTANNSEHDVINVAVRFDKYRLLHPGERLVLVDSFKAVIENNINTTSSPSTLHYYRDFSSTTSVADRQSTTTSTARGGQNASTLQVESFLRCFDEAGGTVLLHVGDKGKFSPIAREEQISGVHTVQNLLRKRFPLTVRLVCGAVPLGLSNKKSSIWPPLGSNSSSSAAPTAAAFNSNSNGYVVPNSSSAPQPMTFAMRLIRCYEEEFAQVFVWSQKDPLVLSIPLNSTNLKVIPAKNMPQLRLDADVRALSNSMHRFLTERGGSNACLQMLTEKESATHDILTAAASSSSSCVTSDQQFLSAEQLSATIAEHHQSAAANINKRRSKKSSLLNLSAKVHSSNSKSASKLLLQSPAMQQQQPPPKWTYDEIDQIYDYVRGLAPPPATPFEIHEDDNDDFENNEADERHVVNHEISVKNPSVLDGTNNNYAVAAHNVISSTAHVLAGSPQQPCSTAHDNNAADVDTKNDLVPPPPCYYYNAALGTYGKPSPPPPPPDASQRVRRRNDNSKTHRHRDRRRDTVDSIRTGSALPPPLPTDAVNYMPPPPPLPPPVETIPTIHHRAYQHMRAFQQQPLPPPPPQHYHHQLSHSASQDMLNAPSNYPQQQYNGLPVQQHVVMTNTPPPPPPHFQQAAVPSSSRKLLFSKFKYKSMNQLPTMHAASSPLLQNSLAPPKQSSPFSIARHSNTNDDPPPVVFARDRRGVATAKAEDAELQRQQPAAMMTPTSATDEPPYMNIGVVGNSLPAAVKENKHRAQPSSYDNNNNDSNQHFIDVDCNDYEQQQQFVVEHRAPSHRPQEQSRQDIASGKTVSNLHMVKLKSLKQQSVPLAETDAKLYSPKQQQQSASSSPSSTGRQFQVKNRASQDQCAHDDVVNGDSVQESTVHVRLRPTTRTTTKTDCSPKCQEPSNNTTTAAPFVRQPTTVTLPYSSSNSKTEQPPSVVVSSKMLKSALPNPPPPLNSVGTNSITKTFKAPTTNVSANRACSSLFLPNLDVGNSTLLLREPEDGGKKGGGVVVMRVRNSAAFDEAFDEDSSKNSMPTPETTTTSTNVGMFGKLKHVTRPSATLSSANHHVNKISENKTALVSRNSSSNTAAVDSGTGTASSSSASSAASLDGLGINSSPIIIGSGGDRSGVNNSSDGNAEALTEQRSVHARIQKFHNMLVGNSSNAPTGVVGYRKSEASKLQQQQEMQAATMAKTSAAGAGGSRRKVVGLIYV